MNILQLVRANILALKPYSSARNEYCGDASIFLDANESPNNAPYNRYPDPLQIELKEKIARLKGVDKSNILLGNGSDEPIDLLIRAFCEPGVDNIVAIDPSYGMYEVAANINNVMYRKVLLNEDFDIESAKILAATDRHTKLIFLCSPNNPTGNSLNEEEIFKVLDAFEGIVVVDEAYIDFSEKNGFLSLLANYENLVVLQTFSKAWASAGVRLGMAFASEQLISILNKIKYPYNINALTQEYAMKITDFEGVVLQWVDETRAERKRISEELATMKGVKRIYPSDANFLLIRVDDANDVYEKLVNEGVIVRNRNNVSLCSGCLRITIGSKPENDVLLDTLKDILG